MMIRVLALCGLLMMSAGCDQQPAAHAGSGEGLSGRLVITGSSTCAPLVTEIARRFEDQHPRVRIDVQTGGSSRGIRDARQGAANIGMSSRALTPEEARTLASTTIAEDRVAFVVHADNPVGHLTVRQLRDIYSGQIRNWSEVGGSDAPIVVSSRAEGRSELTLITEFLRLSVPEIDADVIDGETQQSIKTIAGNRNAITYTSEGAAEHAHENGEPLQIIDIDLAGESTLTLARPLILIRPHDEANELAATFIQFAARNAHADLIQSFAYVSPAPAEN